LGYEIQAGRGRRTLGPYALAGLALGLSTDTSTQEIAAQWTVGGGLEWRPSPGLPWEASCAIASRIGAREDSGTPSGRARRRECDARVSLGWEAGRGRRKGGVGRERRAAGPAAATAARDDLGQRERSSTDGTRILGNAIHLGRYGRQRIRLLRVDSIRLRPARHSLAAHEPRSSAHGAEVPPVIDALRPGDILLLSARPGAG